LVSAIAGAEQTTGKVEEAATGVPGIESGLYIHIQIYIYIYI
jgi:hypothetical protein